MQGKICLITGSNAGIGKATALELARKKATVILHARNTDKAKVAQTEIISETGNNDVHILCADFASLNQVRSMASQVLSDFERLDVLINNAGAVFAEYGETEDGFERQWGINHLAPFLLTNLVLPHLKKSESARIVNVSSSAHKNGKIKFDNKNLNKQKTISKSYNPILAYSESKLANVLFTYELAKKIKDFNIAANVLHPGAVRTSIGVKNNSVIFRTIWKLAKPFMLTEEKGAATSVFLASSPAVEGKTGGYYIRSKSVKSSKRSYDTSLAERLWTFSEKQVENFLSDIV